MFPRSSLLSAFFAAGLALGLSSQGFAEEDDHGHHGGGAMELTLDHGKKWHGDENMYTGMSGIRSAVAAQLEEIHHDRLPAEDYRALADAVHSHIEYMIENCELSEAADEQLHVVLTRILEGANKMEEGSQSRGGAVMIVKALNAYGEHFEHPGWEPLGK
jgi:hypothetical protein